MRLKSALKDWLRRRALAKAGIGIQIHRPRLCQGARSGMWTVDPTDLGPQSVVYSFGIGDNIAWELAMIEHFGCHVHAFDPTPRSLAWLRQQSLPQQLTCDGYFCSLLSCVVPLVMVAAPPAVN